MFDIAFLASIFPAVLKALGDSLLITVMSCAVASLLGFCLEIFRRKTRATKILVRFVIDFIRSTPLLVQLYFFYYVIPEFGIKLPALVVGVWAISLYYSGYLAEVFKAGIDGVRPGQWEGAKALGLSHFQTVMLVIAPQMLRNIAAPLGGYFISIFKATPYLSVIAVPDAFGAALDIASDTFRYTEPMVAAGVIYLTIALAMVFLIDRVEAHFALQVAR